MSRTEYKIVNDDFYINGVKTYSNIKGSNEKAHGLLFNARFIQGIFYDKNNKGKYDRFGKKFDATENTLDLIKSLEQWYSCGIRAITIGIQGGGPICTYEDWTCIDTDAFSKDGNTINPEHIKRLKMILEACDKIGMLVIVSILYQAQEHLLEDGIALVNSVRTTCKMLAETDYTNIIIEVANEYDVGNFSKHPIISTPEGMATVIQIAKEYSGYKFAVGSSGGGGIIHKEVVKASDVLLVHGNGLRREELSRFIKSVRKIDSTKPIVVNEDSQLITQMKVSIDTHTSWGYYNNFTKQEPPTDWSITKGEDVYFAYRMANFIGIKWNKPEEDFYLQGFEKDLVILPNKRFVRLASSYPEKIDYVEFYEDDILLDISYDEPFLMYSKETWEQWPYISKEGAKEFKAIVYLHNGETKELKVKL